MQGQHPCTNTNKTKNKHTHTIFKITSKIYAKGRNLSSFLYNFNKKQLPPLHHTSTIYCYFLLNKKIQLSDKSGGLEALLHKFIQYWENFLRNKNGIVIWFLEQVIFYQCTREENFFSVSFEISKSSLFEEKYKYLLLYFVWKILKTNDLLKKNKQKKQHPIKEKKLIF